MEAVRNDTFKNKTTFFACAVEIRMAVLYETRPTNFRYWNRKFQNALSKDWLHDIKRVGKYGRSTNEQITNSVGIFD